MAVSTQKLWGEQVAEDMSLNILETQAKDKKEAIELVCAYIVIAE